MLTCYFVPGSVELLSFLPMSEMPEKNQLTKRKGLCWLVVSENSICCCLGCCSRTCGEAGKCGIVTLFLWWLGVKGVSRRKPEIKYPLQKTFYLQSVLYIGRVYVYMLCICEWCLPVWRVFYTTSSAHLLRCIKLGLFLVNSTALPMDANSVFIRGCTSSHSWLQCTQAPLPLTLQTFLFYFLDNGHLIEAR